ncbi:odorant receptor 49b-like [Diabrotica virgifera virgifera]|uniref:Odorant receptor n=1 Tax=Diabrotica virgifera virgifera TaxID=50390 RepID=A0ABM5KMQ9_DIAVI|nr:odorant receptor 49b-like [Diabrotica virgifera virgifera]
MNLEDKLLNFYLKLFAALGLKREQTIVDKCIFAFSHLCNMFVVAMVVTFPCVMERSLENITGFLESTSLTTQVTSKLFAVTLYRKELLDLVDIRKLYWPKNKYGESLIKYEMKVLSVVAKGYVVFTICTLLTNILVETKPFFVHQLPTASWVPPFKHGFLFVWFVQAETETFVCTLIYGYDFIFMLTAIELTIQFKMLNHAFKNMKTRQDMLECIHYHRLLLELVDKMKKPYTMVFLFEFLQTTIGISMQLIIVTQQAADTSLKIKGCTFTLIMLVQLAIFSFPSSFLQDEAETCAYAIFESKWYENDQSLKKDTLFLMLEAQREIVIDALGFFQVGRRAFVTVCRSIYSIYALLITVNR